MPQRPFRGALDDARRAPRSEPSASDLQAMALWYPQVVEPPVETTAQRVVAELSALARTGRDSAHVWNMQLESAPTPWQRAQVDWVRHQWAVARRTQAGQTLESALQALSPWFSGRPYIDWLGMVQRLAWLPAEAGRAPQTSLALLLREAAVIAWLEEEVRGARQAVGSARLPGGDY